MLSVIDAKKVLRIDDSNTANDTLIYSLLEAIPEYIETTTGMEKEAQAASALCDTASGFILMLWYYADHADDEKLQRTIDSLLKCITLQAKAAGSNG